MQAPGRKPRRLLKPRGIWRHTERREERVESACVRDCRAFFFFCETHKTARSSGIRQLWVRLPKEVFFAAKLNRAERLFPFFLFSFLSSYSFIVFSCCPLAQGSVAGFFAVDCVFIVALSLRRLPFFSWEGKKAEEKGTRGVCVRRQCLLESEKNNNIKTGKEEKYCQGSSFVRLRRSRRRVAPWLYRWFLC